ncbi:MAG: hypothetical protein ABIM36_05000 [candidate division WOR-3 bacterium]
MNHIKYLIIGIIIAGINSLGAESYLYPDNPIKGPWLYEVQNQIPEEEIAPHGNAIQDNSIPDISATVSVPWIERKEENGNSGGEIEWGTDRLVRSGSSNLWWISLSHSADMTNKRNYAAVLRYVAGSGRDTIFHYYSTDGIIWTSWLPIWYPDGNEVWQVEVLVGRGTNPWIYTFARSTVSDTPNSGALILRRWRADGSTGNWIWIATPGDSIGRFAVDMDENEVLYVAYLKRAGATTWNLYRTRSTDQGLTWETPILVSSGNRKDPEIGVGAPSGYAYISYVLDDTIIRIGRYINWSNPTFTDIETDGDPEFTPSIAASRSASTLTAWCLYRHYHSNTNMYDIHYAYTTNGGSNWTYGVWPPMNYPYGNVRYPWIETAFDYPYNICVALGTTYQSQFDSIITVWAYASAPNSWQGRAVINEHDATGEMPNKIDLNDVLGGTTVLYRQYGSGNVWFDYWWNVGIKEIGKNVSSSYSIFSKNGYAILKFNLPYGRNLKIDIYSSSGRDINRIERYFSAGNHTLKIDLPGKGVYFFKLPDRTEKVINIK